MKETSLEQLVEERQFAGILQTHAEGLFRLSNGLLGLGERPWNKKHYFQLISEADNVESFLDDYGARFNRTYAFITELVASLRWFAMAGYNLSHTRSRMGSYGADDWHAGVKVALDENIESCRVTAVSLFHALREEAGRQGMEITPEAFSESSFLSMAARRTLPRNVGQADLDDEEQKIAEVASKFLAACDMLRETGVRPIEEIMCSRASRSPDWMR